MKNITPKTLAEHINRHQANVVAEAIDGLIHLTRNHCYGGAVMLLNGRVFKTGFGKDTRNWALSAAEWSLEEMMSDLPTTYIVFYYSNENTKEITELRSLPIEDTLENIIENCKRLIVNARLENEQGFTCGRVDKEGHYTLQTKESA